MMPGRRRFMRSALAVPCSLSALAACSPETAQLPDYAEAVRRTWRPGAVWTGDRAALARELVRCATLAPSSHNTQCWKFRLGERSISLLPDLTRRCPVVDPDDHHLFVSLGCAAENLIQAAQANGLQGTARFDGSAGDALRVDLEPGRAIASPLFAAIAERQCTRAAFDGKPLSNEELGLLEKAGSGNGVRLRLLTDQPSMEKVLDFVIAGNTAQLDDPAFVAELKTWIRFSDDEAVRTGDGLCTRSSGNPSIPRWLGEPLLKLLLTARSENAKYASQIRSSAGIAIFISAANDKAHWIEAGRCYERFALQSAALGIRNAMVNQPVELAPLRAQFSGAFGLGDARPDLIVRFGRGAAMPRSLRRPLPAVLA
jgi:hypothetical protein